MSVLRDSNLASDWCRVRKWGADVLQLLRKQLNHTRNSYIPRSLMFSTYPGIIPMRVVLCRCHSRPFLPRTKKRERFPNCSLQSLITSSHRIYVYIYIYTYIYIYIYLEIRSTTANRERTLSLCIYIYIHTHTVCVYTLGRLSLL